MSGPAAPTALPLVASDKDECYTSHDRAGLLLGRELALLLQPPTPCDVQRVDGCSKLLPEFSYLNYIQLRLQ